MTVSELLDKLKDCAPGAEVRIYNGQTDIVHGLYTVDSDGSEVVLNQQQ
jgi:hypothetical protein